ncbi:hypothetical protein [Deinococcus sp. JMULE3]|uniref:hypothetical protein n=1 Tax=Deinococcus sp. JMULE3 TaxID=2518341 RepID=UPI0015762EDB|nr:hypothetical protein [Deinococcus sp. JMULE3]NTX99236.1 hypothetical protein [Deinococcus sp. JMULE3]
MPTMQTTTPNPHPDLPVRSTALTLTGSLNISLQLAGEYGSPKWGFEALRDHLRAHQQLPEPMSAAQVLTAQSSLLSTMLLAEEGLLEDPYGLLSLDALDAALADLTPGPSGVRA